MDHPKLKLQLLLSALAVILTFLGGTGATVLSYGRLTEKVDGMDQRLARIERLLDSNRSVADR